MFDPRRPNPAAAQAPRTKRFPAPDALSCIFGMRPQSVWRAFIRFPLPQLVDVQSAGNDSKRCHGGRDLHDAIGPKIRDHALRYATMRAPWRQTIYGCMFIEIAGKPVGLDA